MQAYSEGCEEILLARLPVDRLEIRHVADRYFMHVGRLARYVNIRPDIAYTISMDENKVMTAALATSADYIIRRKQAIPKYMALQCLLACEEDGRIFLIDGLQRAGIAFRLGEQQVWVRVVPISTALSLASEATKASYRLFEATRTHPVGIDPDTLHTNTIIQMKSFTDLKREGQRLREIEVGLKKLLFYHTLSAVETELILAERLPQLAFKREGWRNNPDIGKEQQILDEWKSDYTLPLSPSWKECADDAKTIISELTNFCGKPALDRALREKITKLDRQQALRLREEEIMFRNILLKAFLRAKDCRSYCIKLINIEHSD